MGNAPQINFIFICKLCEKKTWNGCSKAPKPQSFKKSRRVSLGFGEFINNEYTPLFQRKTNNTATQHRSFPC